jgi:hypothetical protein
VRGVPTVFAVEDTAVQLVWSGLPTRRAVVGVGPRQVEIEAGPPAWVRHRVRGARPTSPLPGGPGAVTIDGLEPGGRYPVWWQPEGGERRTVATATTLRPPPGSLLARFATISDLHVGERQFGLFGGLRDLAPPAAGPYTVRAAAAALAEARGWGATVVVAKGDLTASARPADFSRVRDLLEGSGLRPLVLLGNHDRLRPVDPAPLLPPGALACGGRPLVHDLPGVRLVLGDSPSPDDRWGHLDDEQIARLEAAVTGSPHPAVVFLHHPPERWRVPTSYPPGLVHPDSPRFLDAMRRAGAAAVLCGHTHRNRTYRIGGLLVAEVGSTKDYPGGWAGYAVHEGGLRQVVRRTARPDVLGWTEATRAAVGGLWGRWSPGRLADRCWSLPWPEVG